ncbi:MAG: hypothetical protein RL557_810 [archaeon]|jgi:hypothetical protein
MYEKDVKRYEIILNEIQKKFPCPIRIQLLSKEFSGTARVLWNPISGYRLIVNPQKIKNMNSSAVKGLIAHELSHVEQFLGYNLFRRMYEAFIEYLRINYLSTIRNQKTIDAIESDADYRAIKRGYGKELIALIRFEQVKKIKYKNKYFSVAEVKRIMKNL